MPRGDKSAYTLKQKRQARHIEEGYEKRGLSEDEAERRAWATVNTMTGGGKKSGSGVGTTARPPQGKPRRRERGAGNAGGGRRGRTDKCGLLPPSDIVASRCLATRLGRHFCVIFRR
jgi:hypothetical protein